MLLLSPCSSAVVRQSLALLEEVSTISVGRARIAGRPVLKKRQGQAASTVSV